MRRLKAQNLLFKAEKDRIISCLEGVRFKRVKASYIVYAQMSFLNGNDVKLVNILEEFKDASEAREWLVKNVKGYGFKEASHFLRNIGYSFELAILDRHILKELLRLGAIEEIPKSLSKTKYLSIEEKFKKLSENLNIPLQHLDLLFWHLHTGEIFK